MNIIKTAKKIMTIERMNLLYMVIFMVMLLVITIILIKATQMVSLTLMDDPISIRGYLIGIGTTLIIIVLLIWGDILGGRFPNKISELPIIFHLKIKYYAFIGLGIIVLYTVNALILKILTRFEMLDYMLNIIISLAIGIIAYIFFWWYFVKPINKEMNRLIRLEAEHIKLKWRFWKKEEGSEI